MTRKEIQKQINKAQDIKKFSESLIEEKALPPEERRKISVLDKEIMKACEQYNSIYDKLTKDAARNDWTIFDFEVNDYFDFETFDSDVAYLKD